MRHSISACSAVVRSSSACSSPSTSTSTATAPSSRSRCSSSCVRGVKVAVGLSLPPFGGHNGVKSVDSSVLGRLSGLALLRHSIIGITIVNEGIYMPHRMSTVPPLLKKVLVFGLVDRLEELLAPERFRSLGVHGSWPLECYREIVPTILPDVLRSLESGASIDSASFEMIALVASGRSNEQIAGKPTTARRR